MANHGVYVSQNETSVGTPLVAKSCVPFVIGSAPVQSARAPSTVGMPALCMDWDEAVAKIGYSEKWENYTLCEFMFSHFKLYGRQPVIFCNVLDPATMKSTVAAADVTMTDHKATLPIEAIDNSLLIVKPAGGSGTAHVKGTDYATYYSGESLIIEALPSGGCYSASTLSVAYSAVTPTSVTATVVATGMESIEYCMTTLGVVPDTICAPGFSESVTTAAVMATKAAGINGMFGAKALIDISTDSNTGADSYDKVAAYKKQNNLTDKREIACWPMVKLGDHTFHMSTQLAGLMATVDTDNGGCPYESPSNKAFKCDAMVLASGKEVNMTLAQANSLNANGVVTALNFLGGWTCWGNYTACYPASTDVKDYYIPLSRMFDWIGNTLIYTFWGKLDKPMTRRLIDSIMDTCNIWLNGLVGEGYLLGARVEFKDGENPLTSLMAGIIKIHIYITPPSPAQEIDFVMEYDANYVTAALQG